MMPVAPGIVSVCSDTIHRHSTNCFMHYLIIDCLGVWVWVWVYAGPTK